MLEIWERQKREPSYQFDTPLPATAQTERKRAAVAEEASIGDLAPEVALRSARTAAKVDTGWRFGQWYFGFKFHHARPNRARRAAIAAEHPKI